MPPSSCKVCRHRNRLKIETSIRNGMSFRMAEATFGISDSSLSRHFKHATRPAEVVPGSTRASDEPEALDLKAIEIKTPQDVLDTAQRILVRLDRLAAQAEANGDVRGAVSAISALNKSLTDLFAKVHGLISDQPIVDQRTQNLTVALGEASEEALRAMLAGKCMKCGGALSLVPSINETTPVASTLPRCL